MNYASNPTYVPTHRQGAAGTATIRFVSGPAQGQQFRFHDEAVIGRDPDQCRIAVPTDEMVSRQHCRVALTVEGWTLTDLGSSNGTYHLTGKGRRRISGKAILSDGDEIEVGNNKFAFGIEPRPGFDAPVGPVASDLAAPPPPPPTKKPLGALGVIGGIIGGVVALAAVFSGAGFGDAGAQTPEPTPVTVEAAPQCTTTSAVETIRESVVWIVGQDPRTGATYFGSGFVLREDGYIMTNRHVVIDERTGQVVPNLSIVIAGQERQLPAQVIKVDDTIDLALIKADGIPNLKPVEWASSAQMQDGEVVIAAGFPIPTDPSGRTLSAASFTFGHMSALRVFEGAQYLQHDAEVNPGNSGGALIDECGRVVGVNTQVAYIPGQESRAPGINFAIASADAQRLADQWMPYR